MHTINGIAHNKVYMKKVLCTLLALVLISVPIDAGAIVTMLHISISGHQINDEFHQITVRVDLEDDTGTVMVVRDAQGKLVLFEDFETTYVQFVWEGTDQEGVMLPNGEYTIHFSNTSMQSLHAYPVTIQRSGSAPVLRGDSVMYLSYGSEWVDPGVEWSGGSPDISGVVSTTQLGSTTVTYSMAGVELQRTVVVTPIEVEIALSNLTHVYDGTEKVPEIITNIPATHTISYEGLSAAPTEVGVYEFTVEISEYGYHGIATGTLEIHEVGTVVPLEVQTEEPAETIKSVTRIERRIVSEVLPEVDESITEFFALDIEALQRTLISTGHLAIEVPTGIFGPLTHAALRFYQLSNDIPATGFVDERTMHALQSVAMQDPEEVKRQLQKILRSVEEMVVQVR